MVQSRQQVESDAGQLRRQVDSVKDELAAERRKQSTWEQRIKELTEKLRNAENAASTRSHRLEHEASSLELLNKTKVCERSRGCDIINVIFIESLSLSLSLSVLTATF